MRNTDVVIACLLALTLSGCGATGQAGHSAGDATQSPRAVLSPTHSLPAHKKVTTSPTQAAIPIRDADPIVFERSWVRSLVVTKRAKGGQANVVFVAPTGLPTSRLKELSVACARDFVGEYRAAFCQVFGSEKDYKVAKVDRVEGLASKCWVWYTGIPLAGGDPLTTEMGAVGYEVDECPGSVY